MELWFEPPGARRVPAAATELGGANQSEDKWSRPTFKDLRKLGPVVLPPSCLTPSWSPGPTLVPSPQSLFLTECLSKLDLEVRPPRSAQSPKSFPSHLEGTQSPWHVPEHCHHPSLGKQTSAFPKTLVKHPVLDVTCISSPWFTACSCNLAAENPAGHRTGGGA